MAGSHQLCNASVADAIELQEKDSVVVLHRLRTGNREPVVFSVNYFPLELIKDPHLFDAFTGSLLGFIERHLQTSIVFADTEITVPNAQDPFLSRLFASPSLPIMLLQQVHDNAFNTPLFYSLDYVRNDIFTFHLRRSRG
ncbi:UTRA domain-containing protein [Aureibacillus halotolerans]|uniref:UTRA domain-containing protein n=1 Tax=Aureibacillus halotolerans TaxID=1508390 RepID=UPI0010620C9F|nr:GntR family transcriptional regulator [Aureibacillus halotolerans]